MTRGFLLFYDSYSIITPSQQAIRLFRGGTYNRRNIMNTFWNVVWTLLFLAGAIGSALTAARVALGKEDGSNLTTKQRLWTTIYWVYWGWLFIALTLAVCVSSAGQPYFGAVTIGVGIGLLWNFALPPICTPRFFRDYPIAKAAMFGVGAAFIILGVAALV
jgi:hypothetical protein